MKVWLWKLYFNVSKIVISAYFYVNGYKWKSWLYRVMFERGWNKSPVPLYTTWNDLMDDNTHMPWVADGFKELWDAVASPEHAQWKTDQWRARKDFGSNDCDEFATRIVSRILLAQKQGGIKLKVYGMEVIHVDFCTILWMDGWKMNGHNVALVQLYNALSKQTVYSCVDYDKNPSVDVTEREAIVTKVKQFSPNGILICSAIQTLDLVTLSIVT